VCEGIDTAGLYSEVIAWRERGGEYPTIRDMIATQ
jgi:hypothetical protein